MAMGPLLVPTVRIHLAGYTRLVDWSRAQPVRTHWRLYWNPERGASILSGRRQIQLNPGNMVLIPPNTAVGRRLERPAWSLYIHFSAGQPYDEYRGSVFDLPLERALKERLRAVSRQVQAKCDDPSFSALMLSVIAEALAKIPSQTWAFRVLTPVIAESVRHMEANLSGALRNEDLARRAHMSLTGFIRTFSRQAGRSPQQFLLELRTRQAGILLQEPALSIEQIAEACGFCDRYYLSRIFKRHYGLGPAAYRRALLRGQRA